MSDKSNTLKYNHREKSIKVPFVTYADTEHLLEKKVTCHNKPENISTMNVKKNILHVVIHFLRFDHLTAMKMSMMIMEVKLV